MTEIKSYSQNQEDIFVTSFFKGSDPKSMTLLDIGANDGITFSNSRMLTAQGWKAHLLEPSPKAYALLTDLYRNHPESDVWVHGFGIADYTGVLTFHESGSFENKGQDIALLSCLDEKEKERWSGKVDFQQTTAHFYTFADFLQNPALERPQIFDFISIDAEGHDYKILKQIDLDAVRCRCLCIEYNSLPDQKRLMSEYVEPLGFKLSLQNAENLIFTR